MTTVPDLVASSLGVKRTTSVRLPDGRTIQVQTSDPKQAAAAGRRMLAYEAAAKIRKPNTALDSAVDGATFGLDRPGAAGMYALATGAKNLAQRAMGQEPAYGMGDAFQAARQLENDRARQFASAHPVVNTAAGLLGGLAAPGSKQMGEMVAGAGSFPEVLARSGALGSLLGGVNGAATADPGQTVQGALRGQALGAATGVAVPLLAKGAEAVVNGAIRPAANTVVRAVNKASGGNLLDANRVAAQRLAEALKADGLDSAQITDGLNSFMKNGVTPSLLDIASQNGGGQSTRALLRGAAMKPGPARNVAAKYVDNVAGNLQDRAIDLARNLTPDTRPAVDVADALKTGQRAAASTDYASAYQTPVQLDDGVHLALSGQPGQQAIALARKAAVANQDAGQAFELDRLKMALDSGTPPPPVSAGTLDRIKINLGNLGQGFSENANTRNIGPGYFERAKQIDRFLEQVPELAPARAAYRDFQGQREALDLGQQAIGAHPDELAAGLAKLTDMSPTGAQPAAGIGYRDAMVKQIGAPAEGSTGALNKLSTSTNQGRNLTQVFGSDAAGRFQEGTGQLVDQLQNARSISPETGSATAVRTADALAGPLSLPKPTLAGVVVGLINKVRRGATLTDEERTALLNLGTMQPNASVIDQLRLPPPVTGAPVSGPLVPTASSYAGRQ